MEGGGVEGGGVEGGGVEVGGAEGGGGLSPKRSQPRPPELAREETPSWLNAAQVELDSPAKLKDNALEHAELRAGYEQAARALEAEVALTLS